MERKNWFVRVLIIALCLLLASGITYRFIYLTPRGDLSVGVLIVLSLLVILTLSESFNNFSVGSLLSLSREVTKKTAEASGLATENRELRSQLISIATNVSQKQSSTNIVGLPQELARLFSVTQAPVEEVNEKQAEEAPPVSAEVPQRPVRRLNQRKLEQLGIERFLKANEFEQFPVVREAKLQAQIELIDPVSTSSPIFDGYLNTLVSEIFIEVRPMSRYPALMLRERLYLMLTKLSHYRASKKTNVFLALVFVQIPGEDPNSSIQMSRLFSEFQPAISGGLLRIFDIALTQEDAAGIYVESA